MFKYTLELPNLYSHTSTNFSIVCIRVFMPSISLKSNMGYSLSDLVSLLNASSKLYWSFIRASYTFFLILQEKIHYTVSLL